MPISIKKLPNQAKAGSRPLVTAVIGDGFCNFELACAAEVFGLPRPEFEPGWYRFEICAAERRAVMGEFSMSITPDAKLERLRDASIVIVPGWRPAGEPAPAALVDALRAAHRAGATLVSICSGSFVLAATGLLNGRRATTHWHYAKLLQRLYPEIEVDPSVLYIDEGDIMTSAGSAAGLDLCLHLVRRDYGPEVANQVARRLVIAPHRDGGQAQFVERPVQKETRNGFAVVLDRMRRDLAVDSTIADWAATAAMSERTFIRRFKEAVGTTPGEWLSMTRLDRARELLECSDASIEGVAQNCGFGTAATLRHHFRSRLGITPSAYRDRFARNS